MEKSSASIFLGFQSDITVENAELAGLVEAEPSYTGKSGGPSFITVASDLGPRIELLWSFQCPMTKGYNVTSVDWNKTNRVGLRS